MSVNRISKVLTIVTLLALLLTAVAQVAAADVIGTVTCDTADLRQGAGNGYLSLITATKGELLKVIGRNGDNSWIRVSIYSNRRAAWILSSCIDLAYDVNLLETAVSTGINSGFVSTTVNLRKGPGANFDVVHVYRIWTLFDATGRNLDNSWVQVRLTDGTVGWFSTKYVSLSQNINTLPLTSPTGIADGLPAPLPIDNLVVGFATKDLFIYYGPGDGYGAIEGVVNGAGVYLRGRNTPATWLLVQLDNGDVGWLNRSWLKTDYDVKQLEVIGNS
jgi:uncharacterized protein YgiM (DUF1202 family)